MWLDTGVRTVKKKGKVCFALMQPINLGWRLMYVVHLHNIKYYKRKT